MHFYPKSSQKRKEESSSFVSLKLYFLYLPHITKFILKKSKIQFFSHQFFRYSLKKLNTRFGAERLVRVLSNYADDQRQFKVSARSIIKKIRKRYDEMTKGFFIKKKDLDLDLRDHIRSLRGVRKVVKAPVFLASEISSVYRPENADRKRTLNLRPIDPELIESGQMKPITRQQLQIQSGFFSSAEERIPFEFRKERKSAPFEKHSPSGEYGMSGSHNKSGSRRNRKAKAPPIRAPKFKSDLGGPGSSDEEFATVAGRKRMTGMNRDEELHRVLVYKPRGLDMGELEAPPDVKGLDMKIEKFESGIDNGKKRRRKN